MTDSNVLKTAFLITCLIGQLGLGIAQSTPPNIVMIMTDQQFSDAMSCAMGDQYLSTPHMDMLASSGVRFTRAYTPNPLCTPMRTSMITGLFPHQTGVQTNNDKEILAKDPVFLGKIFKDAGYETGYFGKWHVALSEEEKKIHGFDVFSDKSGRLDAEPAAAFIQQKHEKPFLAFASFLSPHEICQWARMEDLPGGPLSELPPLEVLPPLKPNFGIPQNETDIMAYMRKSYQANHRFPVGNYTDAEWRRLRWGYYRLIERADAFVGEVMGALKASGQLAHTIVVFLSDHGDCAGSHQWNQKTVFYDESARVPLIISWVGKTSKGTSDVLVNTGTDMIPTLCELAGISVPPGLPGKSLKAPALGETPKGERAFVVTENHMIQGDPVEGVSLQPTGRMVRSDHYKYCLYSEGKERESLVDMQFDPLEMVNQAKNPVYGEVLEQHRAYLKKHADTYQDQVALDMLQKL